MGWTEDQIKQDAIVWRAWAPEFEERYKNYQLRQTHPKPLIHN